jgi:hypothetical protein
MVSVWSRRGPITGTALSVISTGAEWAMCIPISLDPRERFALYATGAHSLLAGEEREVQQVLAALGIMAKQYLQTARLEGMTKKFGVPILIDSAVATALAKDNMPVRRIAAVRPAGMSQVIQLYELVLPEEFGGTGIDEASVTAYEGALALFENGDFDVAAAAMQTVPTDRIGLFLSEQITVMRHQGAPIGWNGVINLLSK